MSDESRGGPVPEGSRQDRDPRDGAGEATTAGRAGQDASAAGEGDDLGGRESKEGRRPEPEAVTEASADADAAPTSESHGADGPPAEGAGDAGADAAGAREGEESSRTGAPKRRAPFGRSSKRALEKRGEELEAEVEQLRAAVAEARERWMRVTAEFENFRRRTKRERADLLRSAAEGVLTRLLEVVDAMDAARSAAESAEGEQALEPLRAGIGHIASKLEGLLRAEGVEAIPAGPGTPFDPALHDALATLPAAELEPGSVVQVIQTGYRLGEKVIRPTRVAVAGPAHAQPAGTPEPGPTGGRADDEQAADGRADDETVPADPSELGVPETGANADAKGAS